MLANLIERLSTSGVTARAAMAGSWEAAHARFASRPTIVVSLAGTGRRSCPCRWRHCTFRPTPWTGCGDYTSSGLRIWRTRPARLSPYASAPKSGRRLGQALGHLAEPIDPIRTTEIAEACCAFDEPIGAAKTIATALSWNASSACRLRFEVSCAASVQVALPGQLRRQPMQQNVKALGGFRTVCLNATQACPARRQADSISPASASA